MTDETSIAKAHSLKFAEWLEALSGLPMNDAVAIVTAALKVRKIKGKVLASSDGTLHVVLTMDNAKKTEHGVA